MARVLQFFPGKSPTSEAEAELNELVNVLQMVALTHPAALKTLTVMARRLILPEAK